MANRIIRINEEARKELSQIIRELKDPRVSKCMVSVVAVDIAKDLGKCEVFISVFGDESIQKDCLKGLSNAAGFVRKEMAHRLKLRNTPEITFTLDHSIEHGAHINKILKDIEGK